MLRSDAATALVRCRPTPAAEHRGSHQSVSEQRRNSRSLGNRVGVGGAQQIEGVKRNVIPGAKSGELFT